MNPKPNAQFVTSLTLVFVGNPDHARAAYSRIVEIDGMLFKRAGDRSYIPNVIMAPGGPVTILFMTSDGTEVGVLGNN